MLVAHVRAGIQRVGAVVAHHPDRVIRHGDGTEVVALALLGARGRVDRVRRWVHRVGIVDLVAVDHDARVALLALHGLATGGDHTLDQGVLIRRDDADGGAKVLQPAHHVVGAAAGSVFLVPGLRANEDDDIARIGHLVAAVSQFVHEDAVGRAAHAAVQRRLHRLGRNQVHAAHKVIESAQHQHRHQDDDRHLDPPRVGLFLLLLFW